MGRKSFFLKNKCDFWILVTSCLSEGNEGWSVQETNSDSSLTWGIGGGGTHFYHSLPTLDQKRKQAMDQRRKYGGQRDGLEQCSQTFSTFQNAIIWSDLALPFKKGEVETNNTLCIYLQVMLYLGLNPNMCRSRKTSNSALILLQVRIMMEQRVVFLLAPG